MPDAADKRDTLLVEIRTEELPPGLLEYLADDFHYALRTKLIEEEFDPADFQSDAILRCYATPRRLVALIGNVRAESPPREKSRRGPRINVCYDKNGNATAALQGFMRSVGVENEKELAHEEEKGHKHFAFVVKEPPRTLKNELARIVEAALRAIGAPRPMPKKDGRLLERKLSDTDAALRMMRWNGDNHRFVRPVRGVLMMHGKRAIGGEVMGVAANEKGETLGHRVLNPGVVKIKSPAEYADVMQEEGKVIVSFEERQEIIEHELINKNALEVDGSPWTAENPRLPTWDALQKEVAAMCEYPRAIKGNIAPELQTIPFPCLALCLQKHQRVFPVQNKDGHCAEFIAFVDNEEQQKRRDIEKEKKKMRLGFENVVTARLRDVAFYLKEDKKLSAEQAREKLKDIAYHPKLGSQWERVARIEKIADNIAAMMKLPDEERRAVRDAAKICKADRPTLMIGEYPELEGYMAAYYFAQKDSAVYKIVSEHNLPDMPTGDEHKMSIICLMLADHLEKLAGLLGVGEKADGSKDPYGLRQAAIQIIECLLADNFPPLKIKDIIRSARQGFDENIAATIDENVIYDFLCARAHVLIMKKIMHSVTMGGQIIFFADTSNAKRAIDAVLALRPIEFSTLVEKVKAVMAFANKPEAKTLVADHKRINNIFRKSGVTQTVAMDESLFTQDEEGELWERVQELRKKSDAFLKAREFEKALMLLVQATETIDAFFDAVTVETEDEKIRQNRFALLAEVRKLLNAVADISRLAS